MFSSPLGIPTQLFEGCGPEELHLGMFLLPVLKANEQQLVAEKFRRTLMFEKLNKEIELEVPRVRTVGHQLLRRKVEKK